LARNVAEARQLVAMARKLKVPTGYLEDQLFAPATETGRALVWGRGAAVAGRPYLARAAEEHSGPHRPWFWMGALQGGGVMNDMMCHSVMLVRHLLTKPGEPLSTVRPKRISAHVASLKWTRPAYVRQLKERMGRDVDYAKAPSEDFASLHVEFETRDGLTVIGECSVSWSYVGAGLRLSAELLGPEYSMSWNSLDTGLKLFFSRAVKGREGEDLVEKQNAETGLMPVVVNEAAVYGYEAENRHFARAFLRGEKPALTFEDGLGVVELLMAAYKSAEAGRTLNFPPPGLASYVPACARAR
jgi:predicted dehydrogenase